MRSKEAKRIHETVHGRLLAMGIREGETCNKRVDIEVIGYFDKQILDSSNIEVKPYEDALKGWLIEDDSPEHVRRVSSESRLDKLEPRVEIVIREVEG